MNNGRLLARRKVVSKLPDEMSCKKCVWYGQCDWHERCDYYTTAEEDEEIDLRIEEERYSFREEWYEYVSEFD